MDRVQQLTTSADAHLRRAPSTMSLSAQQALDRLRAGPGRSVEKLDVVVPIYVARTVMAASVFMLPPRDAFDHLTSAEDAFDVPVIVRHSAPLTPARRPLRWRLDSARQPWPSRNDIPGSGEYMVTTTWRDVIDAAMTVGRDPAPWLSSLPDLAWSELVARCSPLLAYLRRTECPVQSPGASGFMVEPNAVYREAQKGLLRRHSVTASG